jgi:Rha family phage regulatory protein
MTKVKAITKIDDMGLFIDKTDEVLVDSRFVAEAFEKPHRSVLRDIRNILDTESEKVKDFGLHNFVPSSYTNMQNKKQPCYGMTKEGFNLLVMGWTGDKAMEYKVAYVNRFKELEAQRDTLVHARTDFPQLTDIVKALHENPKSYHYANECNLVNKVAIGMTAKEYKIKHNIPLETKSIRPYLTPEEIKAVDLTQAADMVMCRLFPNYDERKQKLEEYVSVTLRRDKLDKLLMPGNEEDE